MTNLETLDKKAKCPVITDPELASRSITEFLKMDSSRLYHNSLYTKGREELYRDFCLRRIRLMLDIAPEQSKTVYDLICKMREEVSFSKEKNTGRNRGAWYSSYIESLLLLSRINNYFTIKRTINETKGVQGS